VRGSPGSGERRRSVPTRQGTSGQTRVGQTRVGQPWVVPTGSAVSWGSSPWSAEAAPAKTIGRR